MFLLNSRLGRFTAAWDSDRREADYHSRHPLFRSYGIIMPSSLTTFHSFTLGYSPRPPVSVYGTDAVRTPEDSFSRLQTPQDLDCPEGRTSHSDLGFRLRPWTAIHKAAPILFQCPCFGQTLVRRGRNLRRLSIDYASGASP